MKHGGSYLQLIERTGERAEDWHYQGFLSTTDRDEVDALTLDFPQRWHVEEFFNAHQSLGWNRAGTMNLNIRYGQMTIALIAQAAMHGFRLGEPFRLGRRPFREVSSFVRRRRPGQRRYDLRDLLQRAQRRPTAAHYEGLPEKLERAGINPEVPWLYNYKLDFRFR